MTYSSASSDLSKKRIFLFKTKDNNFLKAVLLIEFTVIFFINLEKQTKGQHYD